MVPWLAAAAIPFLPKGTVSGATNALTGKSGYEASGYTSAAGYDPNAKHYGGSAEASQAAQEHRAQQAQAIDQRKAAQADYGQANYAAQQADYARQEQGHAMGLMRARATGQVPSIAEQQARRDMDRAVAAQSSAAASARSPAGIAMAQQQAAANAAAAQQDISGQAQIAAAQERQAAEQAYYGAASGIRSGDMSQQGLYSQNAQFQAQMQAQNRAMNDQRAMGYETMGQQIGTNDQAAAMQEQGYVAQGHQSAQALNQNTQQQNAQGLQKLGTGVMGAAQGLVGGLGMAMSDVNAKEDVSHPLALQAAAGPYGPIAWQQQSDGSSVMDYSTPSAPAGQTNPLAATHHQMGGNVNVQNKNFEQASKLFSDVRTKDDVQDPMLAQLSTMEPSAYRYKPGMGEDTSQMHVGPMAQNMASAPVTSVAVTKDPGTGMLALDGKRSLKLALGGVGYLAKKQAQQDAEIASLKKQRG